jgi:hypothetical protein
MVQGWEVVAEAALDPLTYCAVRDAKSLQNLRGAELEKLARLLMIYVQERMLDCLASRDEIVKILGVTIELWESIGEDCITLNDIRERFGKEENVELLLQWQPAKMASSIRILRGETFADQLRELKLPVWDAQIQKLFPLTRCIENGSCETINRLVEPIRSIVKYRHRKLERSSITPNVKASFDSLGQHSIAPNIKKLVDGFLDITKPTHLVNALPSSVLLLHSDPHVEFEHLYTRRILGKSIGLLLSICGQNLQSSPSIISYADFCVSLRIKGVTMPTAGPNPHKEIGEYLAGVVTAFRDYARMEERATLWKTVQSEDLAERTAGLILGLGLLDKFALSAVEMLGLISCGHALTEASALLSLAASNTGNCHPSLIKVLLVNIRRRVDGREDVDVDELLQVHPSVRLVSPLALGLCAMGSGDPSISSLLRNLISAKYDVTEKPHFEVAEYVLNCGIALALVNMNSKVALSCHDVFKILTMVRNPDTTHSETARMAAIIGVGTVATQGPLARDVIAWIDELFDLDTSRFDELLLLRTIRSAFVQSEKFEVDRVLEHGFDLKFSLLNAADCFAAGLESFSSGLCIDVSPTLMTLMERLAKKIKVPALDYHSRYSRLVLAICHDLTLLGLCLMRAGSGDELLLRRLSTGFSDPLDYCFARSAIHGLALSLLTLDQSKIQAIIQWHQPQLVKLLLMCSVLPLPPMVPREDPMLLARHLLPSILLRKLDEDAPPDSDDDVIGSLCRWRDRVGSSSINDKVLPLLFESVPDHSDDLTLLARLYQ